MGRKKIMLFGETDEGKVISVAAEIDEDCLTTERARSLGIPKILTETPMMDERERNDLTPSSSPGGE